MKQTKLFKNINQTLKGNGGCRLDDNTFDRFVFTRKYNHPELVFNQNIKYDNTKYRFF